MSLRPGRVHLGADVPDAQLFEGLAEAGEHPGDPDLSSQYARLKGRRGHKKAIGAVAHSILVIA